MGKKINSFEKHCAKHGAKLLKDDKIFLDACLLHINPGQHKSALKIYLEKWLDAPGGKGRFTANTWIRLAIST